MRNAHRFTIDTIWTGNRGSGTSAYHAYSRDHELHAADKSAKIEGSSDPDFRGDATRYNPEELLIGSLAACHMLWFLHLCAEAHIVVLAYRDAAEGTLHFNADGSGEFSEVVLHPIVDLADVAKTHVLTDLHERAHQLCFIARSVNFPVLCKPLEA